MARCRLLILALGSLLAARSPARASALSPSLYRDPVYDGAAQPSVIYHPAERLWYLFYTARRANVPGLEGAAWVHGSPIGVAVSKDGIAWRYRGTALLNDREAVAQPTWWAPEVVVHDGLYHLFVTYVPGIFQDDNHPHQIVHFTSNDLLQWDYQGPVGLRSLKVTDASILPVSGGWRMWYTDETDQGAVHWADSADLTTWTPRGRAEGVGGGAGGTCAFRWRGRYWLLHGTGAGISVYRQTDEAAWTPAGVLLDSPGAGTDAGVGRDPEVVLSGDSAYLFYATQPGSEANPRESVLERTELRFEPDGPSLRCDRRQPPSAPLLPPDDPETESRLPSQG